MKTLMTLCLCALLIVAPVLAVSKNPHPDAEAELRAKCEAGGGCFVVTEEGFKKAMVIAFQRGQEHGTQVGYQFGLKACSKEKPNV